MGSRKIEEKLTNENLFFHFFLKKKVVHFHHALLHFIKAVVEGEHVNTERKRERERERETDREFDCEWWFLTLSLSLSLSLNNKKKNNEKRQNKRIREKF